MRTLKQMSKETQKNFPEWIVVHHTGGTDKYPLMDTSHHGFDEIQSWHLSKGWDNIGYHWVIEKDGKVIPGRPETYHGAHARGVNTKSVGIVLSGNFDATLPTKEQENSLVNLVKDIQQRWNIDNEHVVPHRNFANKTCYGKLLSNEWIEAILTNSCTQKHLSGASLKDLIDELKKRLIK